MVVVTEEHLVIALRELGFPTQEAAVCAASLLDDLVRFELDEFRLLAPVRTGRGIIIEYSFGGTAYSISNARPENCPNFRPTDHGGTQADRENLLSLVRTAEIARERVPELWLNPNRDLKGKFRSPTQHLNTLNEFWWLSRWAGDAVIRPNQRVNPECNLDVDWQLSWDLGLGTRLTVNLEVKRRISDLLRFAQRAPANPDEIFGAGLEDSGGKRKFRPSTASEVNVLGVTLLGEIDHEIQARAEQWLRARDEIDALLLFTRFSNRRSGFDCQVVRKADLLDQVLDRTLSKPDNCLDSVIELPLPYPITQVPFLP